MGQQRLGGAVSRAVLRVTTDRKRIGTIVVGRVLNTRIKSFSLIYFIRNL
jgi:hypothetical protein